MRFCKCSAGLQGLFGLRKCHRSLIFVWVALSHNPTIPWYWMWDKIHQFKASVILVASVRDQEVGIVSWVVIWIIMSVEISRVSVRVQEYG